MIKLFILSFALSSVFAFWPHEFPENNKTVSDVNKTDGNILLPDAIEHQLIYEFPLEKNNYNGDLFKWVRLYNFGNESKYVEIVTKKINKSNGKLMPGSFEIQDRVVLDELAFGDLIENLAVETKIEKLKIMTNEYTNSSYTTKVVRTAVTLHKEPFYLAIIQNQKSFKQRTLFLNFEEYEQLILRSSQLLYDLRN